MFNYYTPSFLSLFSKMQYAVLYKLKYLPRFYNNLACSVVSYFHQIRLLYTLTAILQCKNHEYVTSQSGLDPYNFSHSDASYQMFWLCFLFPFVSRDFDINPVTVLCCIIGEIFSRCVTEWLWIPPWFGLLCNIKIVYINWLFLQVFEITSPKSNKINLFIF